MYYVMVLRSHHSIRRVLTSLSGHTRLGWVSYYWLLLQGEGVCRGLQRRVHSNIASTPTARLWKAPHRVFLRIEQGRRKVGQS